VAALDGLVEHRDGTDLVVRSPDPAELNVRLVAAGVPVRSLLLQRRSLEEIVLEVTGAGSDQFSVPSAGPRKARHAPGPAEPPNVPEPAEHAEPPQAPEPPSAPANGEAP
jgi:hypothetical protein